MNRIPANRTRPLQQSQIAASETPHIDSPDVQKDMLREWLDLEKRSQALKIQQSEIKRAQSLLKQRIMNNMKHSDVDSYQLGTNGVLVRYEKDRPQGISKRYLLQELSQCFPEDPEEADRIALHLLNHRKRVVENGLTLKPPPKQRKPPKTT